MSDILPTYQNRGQGRDCVRLGTPNEPCWGPVQGSSRGLECQGHLGGGAYRSPADILAAQRKAIEEAEQVALRKAEEKQRLREKWEAERWFRPHIERATALPHDPWWAALSEPVLKMVFSMIGEGIRCGCMDKTDIEALLVEAGIPAIAEVQRRGYDWPVGAYELQLAPNLDQDDPTLVVDGMRRRIQPFPEDLVQVDLKNLPDLDLRLWFGCAAHVADYSMLERGTRQTIMALYHQTGKELERRGLPHEFLFDLEVTDERPPQS